MEAEEQTEPQESVEFYLDCVTDRDSFIRFVNALAAERAVAEAQERAQPEYYCLGGASGWQNGNISSFLYAALAYFDSGTEEGLNLEQPTWHDMAEFLYYGKIYE